MLPFEIVRGGSRGATPLGGGKTTASNSFRPHSRQAGRAPEAAAPASASVRTVMLPSSPTKFKAGRPPLRLSSPSSPQRGGSPTQPGGLSPSKAVVAHRTTHADASVRSLEGAWAGGSTMTVPSDGRGILTPDLLTADEVTLNMKAFGLDREMPRHSHATCIAPKFKLNLPAGEAVVRIQPPPPGALDAHASVQLEPTVVTVADFCRFVVDVDEVGMDRSLMYAVAVDEADMFAVPPAIDADGTLTFAMAPTFPGVGSAAAVTLADNASVTDDGDVAKSAAAPFVFRVTGRGAGSRQPLPSAHDWHSFQHKTSADSIKILGSGAAGAADDNAAEYLFQNNNIHALRDGNTDALVTACVDDENDGSTASTQALPLPFAAVVCDVDKLRLVQLMQERTRLQGEAVEPGQRQQIEDRLRERLAAVEQEHGAFHPALCPLLMRQAQVNIGGGAKRHGDAIEQLERIARIRMQALGMTAFTDVPPALPADAVGDEAAEKQRAELIDGYVQSLTVLGTFLKHVARYGESLEFLQLATATAAAALGADSVAHVRALSQVAELHYLLGDSETAAATYRRALSMCSVLFGSEASSTNAVRHVLGVCLVAVGDITAAIKCHELALAAREAALHDAEEASAADASHLTFLVAESLTYAARAHERGGDHHKAAVAVQRSLELLQRFDVSQSAEYTVARSTLQAIAASVTAAQGDRGAADMLQAAAADVSRVRGHDSIEAAIFGAEHGAALVMFGDADEGRRELEMASGILASALGPRHPYAARTCCLLAHVALLDRRPGQAHKLAEHAFAALRSSLGAQHRDTGAAAELCGHVHMAKREDAAAQRMLRLAFDVAKQNKLASREQRLLTHLAAAHGRLGAPLPVDVVGRMEEVVRRVKTALGEASIEALEPLQNVAEAYFLAGEHDRAHHFLSKALKIADSLNMIFLLGPLFKPAAQLSAADLSERNRLAANRLQRSTAVSFAAVLFSIAAVFEAQGRLQEAQSTLLQVLAALELANETNSIRSAETLRALGTLLFRDGHYGDALAYCEKSFNLLLEHHELAVDYIEKSFAAINIVDQRIRANGYCLVRHAESRYRFSVFL
jgi:tetratricopeptide (TPR) repeat protein